VTLLKETELFLIRPLSKRKEYLGKFILETYNLTSNLILLKTGKFSTLASIYYSKL
jgi:hypothetical protein